MVLSIIIASDRLGQQWPRRGLQHDREGARMSPGCPSGGNEMPLKIGGKRARLLHASPTTVPPNVLAGCTTVRRCVRAGAAHGRVKAVDVVDTALPAPHACAASTTPLICGVAKNLCPEIHTPFCVNTTSSCGGSRQ